MKNEDKIILILNNIIEKNKLSRITNRVEYEVGSLPDVNVDEEIDCILKCHKDRIIRIEKTEPKSFFLVNSNFEKTTLLLPINIFQRINNRYPQRDKFQYQPDCCRLVYADVNCDLPVDKNLSVFCAFMFKKNISEVVRWDEIYDDLTGSINGSFSTKKGAKKSIYDTVRLLNILLEEKYGLKKVFRWNNKSVTRTI